MAGRGRTTTFLALCDILMHAHTTPLDTILKRQSKAGNYGLASNAQKLSLLTRFYAYARATQKGAKQCWSTWARGSGK